ncbi:hypothetical protein LCGC14_2645500 [marine sediment metagenome]|uniref:DUF4595 domain-containing protein n=1 Tax=marine sediment metagenome TaxID=412755 RepID=A0A0F9C6T3_9ZZZZ
MVFTLLIMFACQSADKTADTGVKYYRHLKFSETPFDQIDGLHSITADQAEDINHYKFSHDEDGRVISIEYCRGDQLLNGSRTGASMIKISYEVDKELHNYFDMKGEPRDRSGYHTAEYLLDKEGVRRELRFLDSEGNPVENRNDIAWFEWEILANDQLKENRFNLEGEETVLNEFCPFYELRFTYDENGFPMNMANYQGDTMYNCTVENCGDIGVSYFAFEYNDAGDMTQFTVSHLNGQLSNLYWGWAKFQNKYDEHGNVVERFTFDQDNEPFGGMNVPVTQTVYDDHGAVVELKSMDPERNLMDHPRSGIAVTKFTYDEAGHPKDTLKFNSAMLEI